MGTIKPLASDRCFRGFRPPGSSDSRTLAVPERRPWRSGACRERSRRRHRSGVPPFRGSKFSTGRCPLLGTSGRRSGDVWFAARSARGRRATVTLAVRPSEDRTRRDDRRVVVGPEHRTWRCSTETLALVDRIIRLETSPDRLAEWGRRSCGCLAHCRGRSEKPRTVRRSVCGRTSGVRRGV